MVNIQYTKIVIPEGVIANMVSQTVSPDRIIRGRQAFGGKDNLYGGYRNFKLDRVLERR